ncbi:alpha/beta fold hydrolase [Glycomyces algeriensis]|uniref:Oxidoreductase n=1 Tax=Glycomyces algeriensis TaxID=256037 RepID=A0A9W6GAU1_9ACTN|nr:alpha/beta fold hydrolase [Glycomyces algeriensis]MDA1368216.1 alpha/beta fold hydrolase [Glycomyces algeriensis]MDR7351856.1 pimeloyl-ACP methyl ester carboxylesterase [Glycomyces algeriensis]GLI44585.1 oxidoreductase [Glycomyces algeriensis]
MPHIDLSLGTISYEDTGSGPAVLLLHGLVQNATVWREVAADLAADHRVIVPTLPYGSHAIPLKPDADLTPLSTAHLIGEFADALGLPEDTVFVENDAGRLQQLAAERPKRVGRMVIAGCEAFDNYPPKGGGTMMAAAAKLPGGIRLLALALTPRPLRRIPGTGFAVMTAKGVPHELTDGWLKPLRTDGAVRADLVKYLNGTRKTEMLEASSKLADFPNPALVVWGRQDRMMPPEHGRLLAQLIPGAEYLELDDCGTLIPVDRPQALAEAVRRFAAAHPA